MICIPFAACALHATINPPFVFPGERAFIRLQTHDPKHTTLYSVTNLLVTQKPDGWTATALKAAPARFTILLAEDTATPKDAIVIHVPVALSQPPTENNYVAFAMTEFGRCDLVRTTAGDALMLRGANTEYRSKQLLVADVAVRSAPQRPRTFIADYAYGTGTHLTLVGKPGGIAHAVIQITATSLHLKYVALYPQQGTLYVLGSTYTIKLQAGDTKDITIPLKNIFPLLEPSSGCRHSATGEHLTMRANIPLVK